MIGLSIAALFIVVNTIRLTVMARRYEIEIMRYVGATNWFISVPFFLEGLVLGFIGTEVAFRLTAWLYYSAEQYMRRELIFLTLAPAGSFLQSLRLSMLVAGVAFGVFGSLITVRRYLRG